MDGLFNDFIISTFCHSVCTIFGGEHMSLAKILLVDDEPVRYLYKGILESAGFQVAESGNYDQAIAMTDGSA